MVGRWILPIVGIVVAPFADILAQPGPAAVPDSSSGTVRLFLCGDLMLGRGIDQVLSHSVNPRLREPAVTDARRYVELARNSGAVIPGEVDYTYVWGDALAELESQSPLYRIVNLETSITTTSSFWPAKGVHYRMHPENRTILREAGVDLAVLANNHVMDFGRPGLRSTLQALEKADVKTVGAGRNETEATAPAVLPLGDTERLLVFAFGSPGSGVPPGWAATEDAAGVSLLPSLDEGRIESTVDAVATEILTWKRPGDHVVVSVHWGGNWGYSVAEAHRYFAQGLIDADATDIVYGHSSHHPRPIEVYRERLILYGCGDFLNDYEGIRGHAEYRPNLTLAYFADLDISTGRLVGLTMTPMRIHAFRLHRADTQEAEWLADTLSRQSRPYGASVGLRDDGRLELTW